MRSSNLVIPPGPSGDGNTPQGTGTTDRGDSDLSVVGGRKVVVSLGRSEDKECSGPADESSGLPQVSERELSGAPPDGSTVCLPHSREGSVVQGGTPDKVNPEDQEFLMAHIRKKTRKTHSPGWLRFCDF